MVRRERPSLPFDDAGDPAVLFTAVCPPGDKSNSFCFTTGNAVVNTN